MDIVVFLEARIAEEEARLLGAQDSDARLAACMMAECAQKRAILEDWKRGAANSSHDPLSIARRSMLVVLAASYKSHPDYSRNWHDAGGGSSP
ncbi:DUF6221 family protein [Arthrobacter sp. B3I4]|uniref:DUF6221 family protein n=1 Tax=Arthrobacter sp. B3I4 TaxID=3042267 RepID=UPI002789C652|nr:DUF6221 family protein [Arthrobacter sp. B3I4]MDQ0756058.1 hypothetical protein [Arthrobacter sp. B3I4]